MRHKKEIFISLSQIRILAKNVMIILLFWFAVFMMLLSKVDRMLTQNADSYATAIVAPIVHFVGMPARGVYTVYSFVREISDVYSENERLRGENRRLVEENNKLQPLRAENVLLSSLLNYIPPNEAKYITAKVISEDSINFSHSVIAYIGRNKEVKRGQVAVSETGVVGRVEYVGGNYARIMLITDINSRIPVIVERNRVRGILSGDNTPTPKLIFTPLGVEMKRGDSLATSGVAGGFPAGLPIGRIFDIDGKQMKVQPAADLDRLEYVKIIDYGIDIEQAE